MKYVVKIKYDDLYDDVARRWYLNDQLHREDGPAIEYSTVMLQSKSFNHFCPYFLNGKKLTWDEALFNIVPKEKKPVKSLTYNVDDDL